LASETTEAPTWIHQWLVHLRRTGPEVETALDTLAVVLTRDDGVGYEVRMRLYQEAKAAELDHVAFLLLEHVAEEEEFEAERPLDPRGRPLTLGERKSMARGSRRDILQKLVADPHPSVVEILLGNPRLTERDVLAISSRRPVSPATLMQVVRSERFRPRHAVRRSLCLNPHLPVPVASRLMMTLRDRDLRDIGADRNLPAEVRLYSRTLLTLRTDEGA